ncbi:hypothetical protein ACIBI3_44785 [Actinomadura luteofluorescens]|uniref:hypothetical protein n=1 Tax=Actinomadura luteofluorescens TaxID=46163 RepID=UPI003482A2D9
MKHERRLRPWSVIHSSPEGLNPQRNTASNTARISTADISTADISTAGAMGTARVASFQRAEAVAGLLVSVGCIAMAVPGMVTTVSLASAFLLMPIAMLVVYGTVILTGHAWGNQSATPLALHEVRLLRRRTVIWGATALAALVIPLGWVWPLFLTGWIGLAGAIRQLWRLRGS